MGHVFIQFLSILLLIQTFSAIDIIKKNFPWYEQMNHLMGGSPVASRIAVANSTKPLSTDFLKVN